MEDRAPGHRRHRPAGRAGAVDRVAVGADVLAVVVGSELHAGGARVGAGGRSRARRAGPGRRAGTFACTRPRARTGSGVSRIEMPLTATPPVLTRQVYAMGTTAELMVVGGAGPALVEWAVARLEELEASWSRFRPESDLRALDDAVAAAGGTEVPAPPELVDAIGRALSLWYVTDGCFDPTVRRALEVIGYDRTFRDIAPDGGPLTVELHATPGCEGIRVDRERATVTLPRGVGLDLGGIGKGLAADLVATGLVERGAAGACVGLGGDVRTAGCPAGSDTWEIRVEDPLDEAKTLAVRRLSGDAIVTSATRFRRWTRGGRTLHHIIDPASGAPADRGVVAVVAQADEAWWAEGVAKAALVAGVDGGLDLLERVGVAAVVVETDGTRHATTTWEQA